MEKKKKTTSYIIPATFFTSISPSSNRKEQSLNPNTISKNNTVEKVEIKKPILKNVSRRASSLSLKSVHQKKETKKEVRFEENFDNHPKNIFTQKELETVWKEYHTKLITQGQKSIAASFIANNPKLLENFKIELTLPNSLMADQVEKEKPRLFKHLRESLNNYGISLNIIVNETVTKKFAYTPQEKYKKLLEKNPLLAKLKDAFKLEL